MTSDQAAAVFLKRGKTVEEYPAAQAKRMMDLQKKMGTTDYEEVPAESAEPSVTETQTDSSNALNGPTGDSVDTKADKRGSAKAGS